MIILAIHTAAKTVDVDYTYTSLNEKRIISGIWDNDERIASAYDVALKGMCKESFLVVNGNLANRIGNSEDLANQLDTFYLIDGNRVNATKFFNELDKI